MIVDYYKTNEVQISCMTGMIQSIPTLVAGTDYELISYPDINYNILVACLSLPSLVMLHL